MTVADLVVHVRADTKDAEEGLDRTQSKIGSFVGFAAKAATGALVGVGALGAIVGKVGLDFNSMQQQSEIAFTTILGDAGKARDFMGQISQFAAKTPFELGPLTQYASRLAAVGTNTADIIPLMTRLGDATSGMGTGSEGISRAVTALTQMQQKGKVTGEEMLQLTEAGIPAWDALASKLGVDVVKAQEMVTKGQVKANEIFAAIGEGSGPAMQRLTGMMDKQSQSFAGLMSTAKDTFAQFSGAVMGPVFEMATKGLSSLATTMSSSAFMEFGQRVGEAIGQAVNAAIRFGTEAVPQVIAFAQTIAERVVPVLQALASFIIGQVVPALRDFIGGDVLPKVQAFGALLTGTLLPAFQSIAQTAASVLGPALKATIGFLADNKEILGAVAIAIGTLLVASFTAWAISAGAAAVATIAATLPIIAIGAAIAVLAAGIIYLVKNWDDITRRFPILGTVADAVGAVLSTLAGFVTGTLIPGIRDAIAIVTDHWPEIQAVIETVAGAVQTAVQLFVDTLANIIRLGVAIVTGDWGAAWDAVKTIAGNAWTAIKGLVDLGVRAIPAIVSGGMALVRAAIDLAWEGIKALIPLAWEAMKRAVSTGISNLEAEARTLAGRIVGALGDLSSLLYNAGVQIIGGLLRGLKDKVGDVYDFVGGIAGKIADIKGPIEDDAVLLVPHGMAIMGGLRTGVQRGWNEYVKPYLESIAPQVADVTTRVMVSGWEKAVAAARVAVVPAAADLGDAIGEAEAAAYAEWVAVIRAEHQQVVADFNAVQAMAAAAAQASANLRALATTPAGQWPGEKGGGGGGPTPAGGGADIWKAAEWQNFATAAAIMAAGGGRGGFWYGQGVGSNVPAIGEGRDSSSLAIVAERQDETNDLLRLIAELLGVSVEQLKAMGFGGDRRMGQLIEGRTAAVLR